jgi:ribosomal protein S17
MKAKVIIENGETTIVLKTENKFDTDVLEKMFDNKEKYNIHTCINADYAYASHSNHRLELSIKEIK